MKGSALIHVGTSGWHYGHWKGPFYPEDVTADGFLGYYADRFHTVEINNTFYQLPDRETLVQWRSTVPPGFVFAVKASQYITHMKKLKDPEEPVSNFLGRVRALEDRLGPVLFQLPPRWGFNPQRLSSFLEALPTGYRYAFEFRDPSWFDVEAYELLREHSAALCMYHLAGCLSPKEVTSDFIYVRLHGPNGPYQGRYSAEELAGWAGAFATWTKQGKEIYCYFDNDEAGYATRDAVRLQAMIED
jgi:uncharacterized protein YecE (DUF72 family)